MTKGQRVQLHPATDEWMQGDVYGTIVGFRKRRPHTIAEQVVPLVHVLVHLDHSGRTRCFHPDNVIEL